MSCDVCGRPRRQALTCNVTSERKTARPGLEDRHVDLHAPAQLSTAIPHSAINWTATSPNATCTGKLRKQHPVLFTKASSTHDVSSDCVGFLSSHVDSSEAGVGAWATRNQAKRKQHEQQGSSFFRGAIEYTKTISQLHVPDTHPTNPGTTTYLPLLVHALDRLLPLPQPLSTLTASDSSGDGEGGAFCGPGAGGGARWSWQDAGPAHLSFRISEDLCRPD